MKTKNKILVLFLIIPILNLVYLFLYKKDDKILGHLDSVVDSIGQSTGTILVLVIINLIFNFLINKKWEIRLSTLNFIIYCLIIISLFLVNIYIKQKEYTDYNNRINEEMTQLKNELTKYDNMIKYLIK